LKAKARTAMLSDGFVRVTLDTLLSTRMTHLLSGVDGEEEPRVRNCGAVTFITGYTEWVCDKLQLPLSVGWDWSLEQLGGEIGFRRVGMPRTNVMLVTPEMLDYGWRLNLLALGQVVDALPWMEHTRAAMRIS